MRTDELEMMTSGFTFALCAHVRKNTLGNSELCMIRDGEKKELDISKREVWVAKVIPALIFFTLWLDGWFFPLILLPIIYVLFVEKKSLGWLGFSRHEIRFSLGIGVIIALVLNGMYYPIFLYYLPMMKMEIITLYGIFLDVLWYPT